MTAYRIGGIDMQANGLWPGLNFLESGGFGHSATVAIVTTRSQIIYAANHGGIWLDSTVLGHAVAIIHANPKGVVIVDGYGPYMVLWANFTRHWSPPSSPAVFWSVTW